MRKIYKKQKYFNRDKRIFMYNEFVRESPILDKNEEQKDEELLETIKTVNTTLANMHNNLQFANSDLIDYYTYQIKAEEAKYNYLIKLAKKRNLNIT